MIQIFSCSIIAMVVSSYILFKWGDSGFSIMHLLGIIMSVMLGISAGCSALFAVILSFSWFSAEHQANIINREYGTNYTQQEVFYASNVINTVREIQRNRNELTLNVNTNKEKK